MKTYYENKDHKVLNGNILDLSTDFPQTDLIITSPPYNLDMGYGSSSDSNPYDDYLAFNESWMVKCLDISKPDGRFCLNIPLDKNKGGRNSVYADLVAAAKKVGWNYFTTIVWNENNVSRRTAWGSWKSASAPSVMAPVEMIAVFYKTQWKKLNKGESDISRDDFIAWTNGSWTFNGESAKRIGHPAPFPVELPKRCIQLFSYVGDTVFDPFLGSGTVLVAAERLGRKGTGVDIDESYCALATRRLEEEIKKGEMK